ncbi:hypothetical protein BT96DRAFT_1020876 [Gymnopus androsaceus JB14]|uniref:DUF6534 domain-containing protein n=1 Tax=Gymnopus androsaceus JB14 TaxID=1447944 RepID=A0A6A4HFN8_9AGAR|nr:hypothetical protein BT96DRAFT_1020876 [Gymnopus androsaceus JB14]
MSGLSAVEQTQINLSLGAIVVSNCLLYLTMGIVLSAGIWTYDWAVANYANPAALVFTHWALFVEPFLLATCALTVQLFYVSRLWIMSMKNNWILPVVIGCLSILGWCIACWMVHIIATHKLISDLDLLLPVVYIWLGGSLGADALITSSMIYYLDLSFRHKTQLNHRLPRRFRKLIIRIVECNLLSLLTQAITIALFNHILTDMTIAKVYTFSLLVALNCRHSDNDPGTSNGGFSSSRRGGIVELTVLHTSSYPSTRASHSTYTHPAGSPRQGTTGNCQEQTKGLAFNDEVLLP